MSGSIVAEYAASANGGHHGAGAGDTGISHGASGCASGHGSGGYAAVAELVGGFGCELPGGGAAGIVGGAGVECGAGGGGAWGGLGVGESSVQGTWEDRQNGNISISPGIGVKWGHP